ncbi:MAG: hypothetical protein U9O83_04560 [Campylobacterota bacterium]|nr:hypothetical protein [Campylobacterota bacterium]
MNFKRNLKQYKDVEKFADYELTNCIAYEMAIRVEDVIKNIRNKSDDNRIYSKYGIGGEYWLNYHFFEDIYGYMYDDDEVVHTDSGGMYFQPGKYFIKITDDSEETEISQSIKTEGMYINTLMYDNSTAADSYSISPIYKRPHMGSYPVFRDVDVNINFNLPLDEIKAFVEHIYRNQEKDRDLLLSPFEIMGGDLEKSEHEICDKEGKCHDPRKVLSKQQKIADMFFIYDAYKLGWKQSQIKIEISYYHGKQIDEKTINKYYEVAKEYIDNLKYRELLTGVSVKNGTIWEY